MNPKKFLAISMLAAVCLAPLSASADDSSASSSTSTEPAKSVPTIDYAMRASIGLGGGDRGIGGRMALDAEWWSSHNYAIGGRVTAFGSSAIFQGSSDAYAVAPTISFRTSASRSYGVLGFGLGYAHVTQTYGSGLCIFGPCAATTRKELDTVYASASIGWLFHPGPIELGPMLFAEATPQTQIVTLGLVAGVGL